MIDQLLVIVTAVDVESFPDIAADDDSTKSVITHFVQILESNTALGHHMLVDDTLSGSLMQLFVGETTDILRLGDAVEDVLEDDILALGTQLAHLLERVASAAHHVVVVSRFGRIVVTQVDSHQVEFLLEVEVIVNHDTFVVLGRHQSEQSLAEDGLALGLAQMQNVQTLLKQGGEYLIFFYKEIRTGQEYQFHRWKLPFRCKNTKF